MARGRHEPPFDSGGIKLKKQSVNTITLIVERDEPSGWLVAVWDAPERGGLTTQASDLTELQANVAEAVRCHFDEGKGPSRIRLHFVQDPEVAVT